MFGIASGDVGAVFGPPPTTRHLGQTPCGSSRRVLHQAILKRDTAAIGCMDMHFDMCADTRMKNSVAPLLSSRLSKDFRHVRACALDMSSAMPI